MTRFRLNGSRVLEVDLAGDAVKALNGAMIAYDGQISFKRLSGGGEGLRGVIRRGITGEGMTLMEVKGHGTVFLASEATEITLVPLAGHTLFVESENLLALDAQLRTGTHFTGLRGATTGQGLFTTTVEGHGTAAILSDGPAIVLEVHPGMPVCVDPDAYVAHIGALQQDFVHDVNWKSLIGQSSGESFQLRFNGEGLVYVQPAER